MKIALVIPSSRPQQLESFLLSWRPLAQKHGAIFYIVHDTNPPCVTRETADGITSEVRRFNGIGQFSKLIFGGTDSVRNFGFLESVKDGAEVIITLDDDVVPSITDPIQAHLDALAMSVPISWFNPCCNFMRGFPYGARKEARVRVSHGVWAGDPDYDAITRISGNRLPERFPYVGPIPKGCLTPISGMNLAFHRSVAHLVYFAPMGPRTPFNRFGDIWMGVHLKRALDERNEAIYHGASVVEHHRMSDPFTALEQEAAGIREHEILNDCSPAGNLWLPQMTCTNKNYWHMYASKRAKWEKLVKGIL